MKYYSKFLFSGCDSGLSPTCLKLHMKVDVWKTNTKSCKSSPKDNGSILSMISKAGSTTFKVRPGAILLVAWELSNLDFLCVLCIFYTM